MDVSGMVSIFQHSVECHSVCYTKFLGDGDSKAHNLLVEQAVYGNEQVQKLERVGHVQKPMGSRLQSLKGRMGQTCLEHGKIIGELGGYQSQQLINSRYTMAKP